jgi:N-acetylglutamate synthase-like GNAT family acetyltransferase
MERGVAYFVIENENIVAGCVALELTKTDVCYLERLAVLSDQRRRGFGKTLVTYVL